MEQGVSFGDYRFEVETGRLWTGSQEVRLTPKASAVLAMLVARAGQPVSKEDLFATVWSDAAVSDDALTSCIQELRRAFADDARQPRFIETRHRRGYRFVAPLSEVAAHVAPGSPSPAPDVSSIAVLPFADMSPGRDQDYLCEGLAEEIINALTHIDGLRVAARTASFQFRRTWSRPIASAGGRSNSHRVRPSRIPPGGLCCRCRGTTTKPAREFEEAIRLNPNFFEAYYYFARASFASGDIERSAELFGRAADVRQEDFQSAMLQSQSLRMIGRTREAKEAGREGIRRAEHMLALNPLDGRALSLGSGALFEDGQAKRAIEWAQRALELYPDDMGTLLNAACLRSKLRQKEEALALLERVFARGWGKRDWIGHDPDYDILRDDPRFKKLLARLK